MNISAEVQAPPTMDDVLLSAELTVLCAWCLFEQGTPAGEGSHGICKKHAERMLLQWRERRTGRMRALR